MTSSVNSTTGERLHVAELLIPAVTSHCSSQVYSVLTADCAVVPISKL